MKRVVLTDEQYETLLARARRDLQAAEREWKPAILSERSLIDALEAAEDVNK